MKRILTILILLAVLILFLFFYGRNENEVSFKIHIKTNSQNITGGMEEEIKEQLILFLDSHFLECTTSEEVETVINKNIRIVKCIVDEILAQNNLDYKCNVSLCVENSATKILNIKLGNGVGKSFWYDIDPLQNSQGVKYKSKLAELINSFFDKGE